VALLQDAPPAELESLELGRGRGHGGHAARIADGRRTVQAERRAEHVLQLDLARRRHHRHVRDEAQVREVEGAVVRRPVIADEAGAVDGEDDGELL